MSSSETTILAQPRRLDERERQVITFLLSRPFPGRETLLTQLPWVTVTEEYISEDPSIVLAVDRLQAEPAVVRTRIPVEGWGVDRDGTDIRVFLHVVDGYLWELEVLRADGGSVQLPSPSDLRVIAHYEGET